MTKQHTATFRYNAPALEKGLDILELLANHEGSMNQSDIARELGKSQGEMYRMLATLVHRGYVLRDKDSDLYTLSLKLFSMAHRHPPLERLLDVALKSMQRGAERVWQSCHLGMENNGDIVIVASVESPGHWGFTMHKGAVIGLWNTGTGRVLAAFRDHESLQRLLDKHRPAVGEPPLDKKKLTADLERIRQQGYYRGDSETLVGVTNLSFPVFGPDDKVAAVLSCPYITRTDSLQTSSIEETIDEFAGIAGNFSDYLRGRSLQTE